MRRRHRFIHHFGHVGFHLQLVGGIPWVAQCTSALYQLSMSRIWPVLLVAFAIRLGREFVDGSFEVGLCSGKQFFWGVGGAFYG